MQKLLLGAALAFGMAGAANAAAVINFNPGGSSPSFNFTVIDTFDDLSGVTVNSGSVQIKAPPSDGDGAPPANSLPAGTNYLSVLGGGSATINLPVGTRAFQFDWGSIDSYNTLTVVSTQGSFVFLPGGNFPNDANGNQFANSTNGLFTVTGSSAGETFTSLTLESTTNSFEIDNLATSVIPEPATWAMLIMGFGLVGFAARRRERMTSVPA